MVVGWGVLVVLMAGSPLLGAGGCVRKVEAMKEESWCSSEVFFSGPALFWVRKEPGSSQSAVFP